MHNRRTSNLLLWTLGLCALATHAGAVRPAIGARSGQALLDGEQLLFSFDLVARNPDAVPIVVRAADYAVTVEGRPLFSGTTQAFVVGAGGEQAVPVAGFGNPAQTVLQRLRGKQRFTYRIRGTAHLSGAGEVPFSVEGLTSLPDEAAEPVLARARTVAEGHSLLSY